MRSVQVVLADEVAQAAVQQALEVGEALLAALRAVGTAFELSNVGAGR